MTLEQFLEKAWNRYCILTPDADRIHRLLEQEGEKLQNDHVAFRTFDIPGLDRYSVGRMFEQWGYKKANDELDFPEKKLKAHYYLPPRDGLPKIFISELLLNQVSKELRSWINETASPHSKRSITPESLLEPTWSAIRYEDYERFYMESEYAAWTLAYGIQVNHFTVFVNSMKKFKDLPVLNEFLKTNSFTLNSSGGEIKGTPAERLEQSSTMAKKIPWTFAGGRVERIAGCYYEFAKRYPDPETGKLFQGFVPKSADKIFESTFVR